MKAGRMRSRIEVFRPVKETDGYGASTDKWQSCGIWWAERAAVSGRRTDEASEHFADMTIRYNIRDRHHVEPNWQLDGDDGLRYIIVAVERYPWLGMLKLICERLNP